MRTSALKKAPLSGFVVRLFLAQNNADAAGGHLFIAPGNRVTRNTPKPIPWWQQIFPRLGRKMTAVIEIPPGVDAVGPSLFSWWSKGTIYADDFSIEKVDASVPVTPLWQTPSGSSAPAATAADASPITVSDEELLAALNLDAPGMEKVKAAAQADPKNIDWKAVQSAYLDYRPQRLVRRAGASRPRTSRRIPRRRTMRSPTAFSLTIFPTRSTSRRQPSSTWARTSTGSTTRCRAIPRRFRRNGPLGRLDAWTSGATWARRTGRPATKNTRRDGSASSKILPAKNPMRYAAVPGVASLWRPLDSAIRISISWPNAYYHFLSRVPPSRRKRTGFISEELQLRARPASCPRSAGRHSTRQLGHH